jgi:hypothetical protein
VPLGSIADLHSRSFLYLPFNFVLIRCTSNNLPNGLMLTF